MTIAVPAWFWVLVFSNICAFAFWKGGPSERVGALGMILAWLSTAFFENTRWAEPQTGVMITDAALFLFLAVLALRSDRFWPMCAAGFQLLIVLTHIAWWIDAGLGKWAYFTAVMIWGYLVLIALLVGTANRWRQRARLRRDAADARADSSAGTARGG